MHRTEPPLAAAAICLAALAGFVDALAFTSLGGFFASFMSGNSTRLGVSLGTAGWGNALVAGGLILSFVSGVIVASVIVRAQPGRRSAVVALTTLLLAAAALLANQGLSTSAGLAMAAAMGGVHLMLLREAASLAGLTALLTQAAARLADALMGGEDRTGWLGPLLLWGGFVAGAALGAAAGLRLGAPAIGIAAAAGAALTLWLETAARRTVAAE